MKFFTEAHIEFLHYFNNNMTTRRVPTGLVNSIILPVFFFKKINIFVHNYHSISFINVVEKIFLGLLRLEKLDWEKKLLLKIRQISEKHIPQ